MDINYEFNQFDEYLLSLSENEACAHLFICIQTNSLDAHRLIMAVHGCGWRCEPGEIPEFMSKCISELRELKAFKDYKAFNKNVDLEQWLYDVSHDENLSHLIKDDNWRD